MQCKHCEIDFIGNKSQFANHVRWCDKNPRYLEYRHDNSIRGKLLGNKKFGDYKKFDVVCAACNTIFSVKEREELFPKKEKYYCTRICANSEGGKAKALKYHTDDMATYYTVAWRHHDRICLICGEDKIVAAHHVNENHNDNDPKNLVPLCPTHHQYMHSRHKILIEDKVNKYIQDKWAVGLLG
jgi:hypothetical protein